MRNLPSRSIGEMLGEVGKRRAGEGSGYADSAVNIRSSERDGINERASEEYRQQIGGGNIEDADAGALSSQGGGEEETNYKEFEPWLSKSLDSSGRRQCVGYTGHIYNALLDPFEPDETAEKLTKVFAALAGRWWS